MIIPFNQLPDHARIWIYPSNRTFTEKESVAIRTKTDKFLEHWTAHGAHLQAAIEMPYDRFIVLGLNESIQSASGCSIDASVRFIQSLEEEFDLILLDKMNVTFRQNNELLYVHLKDFRTMAKKKEILPNVVVFNNLVLNKSEYKTLWEVPATSSWHSRYF
jgi:hypothetical protein